MLLKLELNMIQHRYIHVLMSINFVKINSVGTVRLSQLAQRRGTHTHTHTVEPRSTAEHRNVRWRGSARRVAALYSSCLFCAHDDPLFQGLPCQPFLKFSCYDHCCTEHGILAYFCLEFLVRNFERIYDRF